MMNCVDYEIGILGVQYCWFSVSSKPFISNVFLHLLVDLHNTEE